MATWPRSILRGNNLLSKGISASWNLLATALSSKRRVQLPAIIALTHWLQPKEVHIHNAIHHMVSCYRVHNRLQCAQNMLLGRQQIGDRNSYDIRPTRGVAKGVGVLHHHNVCIVRYFTQCWGQRAQLVPAPKNVAISHSSNTYRISALAKSTNRYCYLATVPKTYVMQPQIVITRYYWTWERLAA